MPPKGLYSMARHHLYGGQMARHHSYGGQVAPRRSFNSNDFHSEPEKPTQVDPAVRIAKGANQAKEGDEKRTEKKKAKKKSLSKDVVQEPDEEVINGAKVPPVVPESKEQRKERRKRKKEEVSTKEAQTAEPRKKKRKRESATHLETPTPSLDGTATGSFVVGTDLVENVMASLSGREISGAQLLESPQTPEKVPKKRKKSSRKSEDVQVEQQQKPVVLAKEPEVLSLEKPKVKKSKKRKSETVQQQEDEPLPIKTPRNTPVPLPQLSHILVPETPPSKTAQREKSLASRPVPISQSQAVGKVSTQRSPRNDRVTILLSTPTSAEDARTPKSAPPATTHGVSKPTVPNALTDANLSNHTKPAKENKLKRRSKSGMSTVTSLPESASTRSIIDAFARVGKPYARSGAEVDPFVSPEILVKQRRETHEEASMNVFNDKFHEVQKAVNFSEERGYLEDYLAWGVENASNHLPCLGNVTGCTSKKEEILRLSKEENLTILSHLDTEAGDLNALKDAANRIRLADELLMLSLKARVPVPIGRLEGTWTLYCPKYAETHFDRYGYGQRTLTISSIAGFKHKNSYTARLNIPPRSMSYSLLAFSTPPHASFRTTSVRTAAEGYTVDVVFLGNGYLQLRADLKLLLKGKATEEFEGKKVHMEFIGVHEQAVKWFEEKNELEEEAKKLFAKYDGGAEE
jgi:hypothetical protein